MMIKLTPEQEKAYVRFISARDRVGILKQGKAKWIPHRDCFMTVDVVGMNHPLFMVNDEWLEYKEAFQAWLDIEPEFRKTERMSMIRGDYDNQDSWRDKDGR